MKRIVVHIFHFISRRQVLVATPLLQKLDIDTFPLLFPALVYVPSHCGDRMIDAFFFSSSPSIRALINDKTPM